MMPSDSGAWMPRSQSPSLINKTESVVGWLAQSTGHNSNGNMGQPADPWLVKPPPPAGAGLPADPWLSKAVPADPWLPTHMDSNNQNSMTADPWAPNEPPMGARPSPVGAFASPISDYDEFDIITNRSKSALSSTSPINNGSNNNNCKCLVLF